MVEIISISNAYISAEVVPERGGGLAAVSVFGMDLLYPVPRPALGPYVQLSNMVLVPWSNVITGGGFRFAGTFFPVEPTRAHDGMTIHGNGPFNPWSIRKRLTKCIELGLSSKGPGPFAYDATLTYAVEGADLTMSLRVKNEAAVALPYGLGFHPFFRRTPLTRLKAKADGVWLRDQGVVPALSSVNKHPEWDFSASRELPRHINHGFVGWDGKAEIDWPEFQTSVCITGTATLGTYILFVQPGSPEFFCFEPVSHPIDAHNLPGQHASHGLVVLERGEAIEASCSLAFRKEPVRC